MANKQLPTKTNKPLLVESLDQKHQEAVLMLYDGMRYRQIAKELNTTYGTVRQWFMTGGLCEAAYKELLKLHTKENKKLLKKIDQQIQESLPDAVATLRNSAKGGNWKAAESLLHIGGFSPLQKIQAEIENKDTAKIRETSDQIAEYVKSNIANGDTQDNQ